MENITFEQFALILAAHVPSVSLAQALSMFDALVVADVNKQTDAEARMQTKVTGELTHEQLVEQALNNPSVMGFIAHGQKIQAFKALRDSITDKFGYKPTLLATKNAVEDIRVTGDIRDIE